MTRAPTQHRKPAALRVDDPAVRIDETEPEELTVQAEQEESSPLPVTIAAADTLKRGIRWGGILFSAIGGLVSLAAGLWLADFIQSLVARQDWLGWLMLGLLVTGGFAALMIMVTEVWALMRLRRLGQLHRAAQSAINHNDDADAAHVAGSLKRLYSSRADLAWGLARLGEHDGDIMDGRERLVLVERELVAPLDLQAKSVIAASARRVSVLTAVSPSSIADIIAVSVLNLRMLRRIAAAYGARPGTIGLIRLARMVLTHIVLTGGIAIGDDLIQQLVGHRFAAKLSARFGEGIFNGALTARIGLAAIEVCRPLPFIEAKRPRLRDLLSLVVK